MTSLCIRDTDTCSVPEYYMMYRGIYKLFDVLLGASGGYVLIAVVVLFLVLLKYVGERGSSSVFSKPFLVFICPQKDAL